MIEPQTVTPLDIQAAIIDQAFFYDGTLTICRLTLVNGTKVIGESACADPQKYDKEKGEMYARQDAERQIWPRLGYALREKLHLIEKAGPPFGRIFELGDVKTYVGTKVVHAVAMTRQAYNDLRGWQVPADENPSDEGYLVQYADSRQETNVTGFQGYVSWSPRDVFERAYEVGARRKHRTLIDEMVRERDELEERVVEVMRVIRSESFGLLSVEAQTELHHQLQGMELYLAALKTRVNKVL